MKNIKDLTNEELILEIIAHQRVISNYISNDNINKYPDIINTVGHILYNQEALLQELFERKSNGSFN